MWLWVPAFAGMTVEVRGAEICRVIQHLIEQIDENERRTYLAESLFLNTVKYENDKLESYMRKLTKK